jgi:hypothetical protein
MSALELSRIRFHFSQTELLNLQTELPQEYLELEKRIDQLKLAHLKLLNVTYRSPIALLIKVEPMSMNLMITKI